MLNALTARLAWVLLLSLPLAAVARAADESAPQFTSQQLEHFEKKIRPLLAKRCYDCHSTRAERLEASLYLDSRAGLLKGGDTGPAIVPGDAENSLLVDSIRYGDIYQMPPTGKLPPDEIRLLTDWINDGAPWPAEAAPMAVAANDDFDLEARMQEHWVWQPMRAPHVPEVQPADWPVNAIDHFILARLNQAGLTPAAAADRRTLMRRVYFDLIGLPPTPTEISEFLHDTQPGAYERLVDRLLDSPHFGERWGRHWLDLVRYAESRGHEFDYDTPNAYQYRDYVIRALNADVPYDQFVLEHLAGDLLEYPRRNPAEGFNESILGTGFWFLGEWVHSPVDIRKDEADRHDNMIDVFGKTFLGMTIACARCHNHKFDPISQRDYYAMSGYLQSSCYRQARFDTLEHNRQVAEDLETLREEARRELNRSWAAVLEPQADRIAEYLLAAQDVLGGERDETEVQPDSAAADATSLVERHRKQIAQVAATRQLNERVLRGWVRETVAARDDDSHPLRLWADLLSAEDALNSGNGFDLARRVREQAAAAKRRGEAHEQALDGCQVVCEFNGALSMPWIQDGSTFGLSAVRPGELLLSSDPARPLPGVATFAAAQRMPLFADLRPAPGAQNDAGRLGGWVRAGRTLRTPTFTLEADAVHYLVAGQGHGLAVVDSHRMINGPLHGNTIRQWDAADGRLQWVTQPLGRYRGHRLHLEFSPHESEPLSVLMVVQGPRPGNIPFSTHAADVLHRTLETAAVSDVQALARAYQQRLATAVRQVGEVSTSGDVAPDAAVLADWVARHSDLFLTQSDQQNWLSQAAPVVARWKRLAERVRNTSRLAPAMWEGVGENEHVMIRGSHLKLGDEVPRNILTAVRKMEGAAETSPASAVVRSGSGRLQLARRVVDPSNPLTARVAVNRMWHHLFGRGLVGSVDNFGVLGEAPTHPELLDHLALQFLQDGWSVKRMIRRMVLSQTYRQSSRPDPAAATADPANRLLHRMRIRRLDAEAIRDAMLTVSGRLDRRLHGPSVPVHLTSFMQGRGRPQSGPVDGAGRRSIYNSIRRNFLSPMLLAFDMPQPFSTVGRRTVSNVPAQALILMNDPFVIEQASQWAQKLLADPALSAEQRVIRMYEAAYARQPSETEVAAALTFLDQQAERLGISPAERRSDPRVWADLGHVLFNVKEFVFVN